MHLSKEYEKAIDSSNILSRANKGGKITYVNDEFLINNYFNMCYNYYENKEVIIYERSSRRSKLNSCCIFDIFKCKL
jgi:hypothetical protein